MRRARFVRCRRWQLLGIVSFAAVSPALAFDHAAVAKRTLEQHILPGYARFDAAAHTFAQKTAALCQAPSPTALAEARDSARDALLAWGRIEHIRFGPITENKRLDRLIFYPDPRGFARKQIARLLRLHDEADLAPDKLAQASVAVQGFTAVDRVLWGKGSDALASPRRRPRSAAATSRRWPTASRRWPPIRSPLGRAPSSRLGCRPAPATARS